MASKYKPKDGEYFYAPHRGRWGIWQNHELGDGISDGTFIQYCDTREEAAERVKALNGWFK
jgi:hypothetical protein